MITSNNLPNIDCNNSEVKKLLSVQSKSRPTSPNPTYVDNDERTMEVDNFTTNPFDEHDDEIQQVFRFIIKSITPRNILGYQFIITITDQNIQRTRGG